MRVFEKIRTYIEDNNISYIAISKKTGISEDNINAIFDGKRTLYADELKKICLALDISPEYFLV